MRLVQNSNRGVDLRLESAHGIESFECVRDILTRIRMAAIEYLPAKQPESTGGLRLTCNAIWPAGTFARVRLVRPAAQNDAPVRRGRKWRRKYQRNLRLAHVTSLLDFARLIGEPTYSADTTIFHRHFLYAVSGFADFCSPVPVLQRVTAALTATGSVQNCQKLRSENSHSSRHSLSPAKMMNPGENRLRNGAAR